MIYCIKLYTHDYQILLNNVLHIIHSSISNDHLIFEYWKLSFINLFWKYLVIVELFSLLSKPVK